jgi:hypothetical protein
MMLANMERREAEFLRESAEVDDLTKAIALTHT